MKKERISEVEGFFVTWVQYFIFVFVFALVGVIIVNGLYGFIIWDWNDMVEQIKHLGWLSLRITTTVSVFIAFFMTLSNRGKE